MRRKLNAAAHEPSNAQSSTRRPPSANSPSIPFPAARSVARCWPRWRRKPRPIALCRWRQARSDRRSISPAIPLAGCRCWSITASACTRARPFCATSTGCCRRRPSPPGDCKAAARMDQAMNVNDWYLFQGVANVIAFHRVVGPRLMGFKPDEVAIEAAMPKAHAVFAELARLLGEQRYFTGDAVSLADLLIAPQLAFFTQTPEWSGLSAPHGNIIAWLARMEARPSFQATALDRVAEMAKAA